MTGSESPEEERPRGGPHGRSPLDRPIALAAPLLDVLLWAGERISRLLDPVDHEHYPVRSPRAEDSGDEAGREERGGGDR